MMEMDPNSVMQMVRDKKRQINDSYSTTQKQQMLTNASMFQATPFPPPPPPPPTSSSKQHQQMQHRNNIQFPFTNTSLSSSLSPTLAPSPSQASFNQNTNQKYYEQAYMSQMPTFNGYSTLVGPTPKQTWVMQKINIKKNCNLHQHY